MSVDRKGNVVRRTAGKDLQWWTWAGTAANRSLHACLRDIVVERQQINGRYLRLDPYAARQQIIDTIARAPISEPAVDAAAAAGLKFSAALPPGLAERTVAERMGDSHHARVVLREPLIFVSQ